MRTKLYKNEEDRKKAKKLNAKRYYQSHKESIKEHYQMNKEELQKKCRDRYVPKSTVEDLEHRKAGYLSRVSSLKRRINNLEAKGADPFGSITSVLESRMDSCLASIDSLQRRIDREKIRGESKF
jgi:hypothetical protein